MSITVWLAVPDGLPGLTNVIFARTIGMSEATASRLARTVALTGAAIALALTPLLPPGLPILIASAAALLGLRRG